MLWRHLAPVSDACCQEEEGGCEEGDISIVMGAWRSPFVCVLPLCSSPWIFVTSFLIHQSKPVLPVTKLFELSRERGLVSWMRSSNTSVADPLVEATRSFNSPRTQHSLLSALLHIHS